MTRVIHHYYLFLNPYGVLPQPIVHRELCPIDKLEGHPGNLSFVQQNLTLMIMLKLLLLLPRLTSPRRTLKPQHVLISLVNATNRASLLVMCRPSLTSMKQPWVPDHLKLELHTSRRLLWELVA